MTSKEEIFQLIRATIRGIAPDAEIILYGSRARGTNRDDSDWDVLVLVDVPKLTQEHKDIDYALWDKGLDFGQQINSIIRTTSQWRNNKSLFKHNILTDGIRL